MSKLKKPRFKIATLTGGAVLAALLIILLAFNIMARSQLKEKAYDALQGILAKQDEYEPTLYYPDVIVIDLNFEGNDEDLKNYTAKERSLIEWCRKYYDNDIQMAKIGVNTYYVAVAEDEDPAIVSNNGESGYTYIAYVDVTGEPEMISWISRVFLIVAFITGGIGAFLGYLTGKKIEQTQLMQKQFFENTSHELKTPLAAIRGYGEGIETGVITDYKKTGHVIAIQSEKMAQLVEEILCMSKLEGGAVTLHPEPIKADEFLENCLMPFEGTVMSKGLSVELELTPERITADPDRLEHAVTNLMTNAIKFAKSTVRISNDRTSIRIWNDCDPISADELKHIFDRFYTGKNGNTGIGLAIAKEIITLHGWELNAYYSHGGLMIGITGIK